MRAEVVSNAALVPAHIALALKSGQTPGGNSQKRNQASTVRQKQRRGQGSVPGVATGKLTQPSRWSVSASGGMIVVKPPESRRDSVRINARRGYVFVGVPRSWLTMARRAMLAVIRIETGHDNQREVST
jgi:hypothetical protein